MTDTRYEATYTDRMKAITLILESELADLIPQYTRNSLKACLASEKERESTASITVSFLEPNLRIEPNITFDVTSGLLTTRDDGSVWRTYKTRARVWFPSVQGFPNECRVQMALQARILELAETLPINTHEVCLRTAEEEATRVGEQKAREERARVRDVVERATDLIRSGMRVGWKSSREVPRELLQDVPAATYEIVRSPQSGRAPSKKYELVVYTSGRGDLKRLS